MLSRTRLVFGALSGKSVGFVGLGNMGGFMARNILNKHIKADPETKLYVLDTRAEVVKEVENLGATACSSIPEVAKNSDFIVTMLPDNNSVLKATYSVFAMHPVPTLHHLPALAITLRALPSPRQPHLQCYGGPQGIFATCKEGASCLDASTIGPVVADNVAEFLTLSDSLSKKVHRLPRLSQACIPAITLQCPMADPSADIAFVQAPVSGGVGGAEKGTLTFMAGGPSASFDRLKPVMDLMGANIFHCGDKTRSGAVIKLANNLVLAGSMIAVAEGMAMGTQMGVDPKIMHDIMAVSTARCWSLDTYNPFPGVLEGVPSSRNYDGGFANALMLKDLSLARESHGKVLPGLFNAIMLYSKMCDQGMANKDFSSVIKLVSDFENASGQESD
eukprot:gene5668-140_t